MPVYCASLRFSAQPANIRSSIQELFSCRPAVTLERSVGRLAGADAELWQNGSFGAEVIPDLPVVSSWKELGAKLLGRCIQLSFE